MRYDSDREEKDLHGLHSHGPCVTWSSEIILICWFAAQETFLIIINVESRCAASYFCENCDTFNFSEIYDEYKVQKNSVYLKQKYSVAI